MKTFTIAEISRETQIPESTLRYRTKLFKKHIKTTGKGRKRRFLEGAIEKFVFIDKCFQDGSRTELVSEELEAKFGPEVLVENNKKTSITKKGTKNMSIDLEVMRPIMKVIENQEIIITELRVQNKMLKSPVKKGFISKIFGS